MVGLALMAKGAATLVARFSGDLHGQGMKKEGCVGPVPVKPFGRSEPRGSIRQLHGIVCSRATGEGQDVGVNGARMGGSSPLARRLVVTGRRRGG